MRRWKWDKIVFFFGTAGLNDSWKNLWKNNSTASTKSSRLFLLVNENVRNHRHDSSLKNFSIVRLRSSCEGMDKPPNISKWSLTVKQWILIQTETRIHYLISCLRKSQAIRFNITNEILFKFWTKRASLVTLHCSAKVLSNLVHEENTKQL